MKEYMVEYLKSINFQHPQSLSGFLNRHAKEGWILKEFRDVQMHLWVAIFEREKDLGECGVRWKEGRQSVVCGHPLPCPIHKGG